VSEARADVRRRGNAWVLAAYAAILLPGTCALAAQRSLWHDELATFYLARLSEDRLWAMMKTGAEAIPPFFYDVTRIPLHAFGWSELPARLPAVLGFCLLGVCLFHIVGRRIGTAYGAVAMFVPLVTSAYRFAHEARPYGLVLGLAGLAVLAWQIAGEGRRRPLALVLLALSVAAAVGCHYYSVFVVLPLMVGELARSKRRRRFQPGVWIALTAALVPLIAYLPLIRGATVNVGVYYAKPSWGFPADFYLELLGPSGPAAALTVALVLLLRFIDSSKPPDRSNDGARGMPPEEIVAALGFMAIPIAGAVAAHLYLGTATMRYLLFSALGVSIALPILLHRLLAGSSRSAVIVSLGLGVCALGLQIGALRSATGQRVWLSRISQRLECETSGGLSVVLLDSDAFLRLNHYGSRQLAARLVYVAEPDLSLHYLGHNTNDRSQLMLRSALPGDVERYAPFVSSHDRFLVYGSLAGNGYWMWLLTKLLDDGYHMEVTVRDRDELLFLVSHPQAAGAVNDSRTATTDRCR
jgi:hypothetical protein